MGWQAWDLNLDLMLYPLDCALFIILGNIAAHMTLNMTSGLIT